MRRARVLVLEALVVALIVSAMRVPAGGLWVLAFVLTSTLILRIAVDPGGRSVERSDGRAGSSATTNAQLFELVSAVTRYRTHTGAPPARLSDLVPDYVPCLPQFGPQRCVHYEAVGQGFSIELAGGVPRDRLSLM